MKENYGYHEIADELRDRIRTGIYLPGMRLPPERTLCRDWNVERTTLRRALAVLSAEGLIIKRPGYGSMVAGHESAPTQLISFITSSPSDGRTTDMPSHHFLSPVYNAFAELCAKDGYRSISMMLAGVKQMDNFDAVLDSSCAVILADRVPKEFLEHVRKRGVPCVLMSERAPAFRSVLIDNGLAMSQAVDHLVSLGHQKIAYIGGDDQFYNAKARINGFGAAMYAHDLASPLPPVDACGWSMTTGFDGMQKLLLQHPDVTAVCTANDEVAGGVCRAAAEFGLRIPEDLSVIGFGASLTGFPPQPDLTTIRISYERFAREMYRALLCEMEHPYAAPASVMVETELVVRGTTAPCKSTL